MKFLYLLESIISFCKLSGSWNTTEFFSLQCIFIIFQVPTDLRLSILHVRMLWSGLIWFQSVGFLASTSLVMAFMSHSYSSWVCGCCSRIVSIFCYLRGFNITAYGNRKWHSLIGRLKRWFSKPSQSFLTQSSNHTPVYYPKELSILAFYRNVYNTH